MANVAIKKVLGHLWYLSEEVIPFAFFDDGLTVQDKKKMVDALKIEGVEDCPKRKSIDVKHITEKSIEDFVTSNSLRFFQILGISSQFLNKDVETWDDDDFEAAKKIVHSMRVVNDIAERVVALMEEFNKLITTDEKQKQYLLLLVKEYRKKYPDTKKSTLVF